MSSLDQQYPSSSVLGHRMTKFTPILLIIHFIHSWNTSCSPHPSWPLGRTTNSWHTSVSTHSIHLTLHLIHSYSATLSADAPTAPHASIYFEVIPHSSGLSYSHQAPLGHSWPTTRQQDKRCWCVVIIPLMVEVIPTEPLLTASTLRTCWKFTKRCDSWQKVWTRILLL